jgi:hypothetical protein
MRNFVQDQTRLSLGALKRGFMRVAVWTLSLVLVSAGMARTAEISSPIATFGNGDDALGGLWLAVARNGAGFNAKFNKSAHICNVKSSVPLVVASDPVTGTSAPPPWSVSIAQGHCACIDYPASLFVENTGALQLPFSGTYQWLSAKACKAAPTTVGTTIPPQPRGTAVTAKCFALSSPDWLYSKACRTTLLWDKNRLCMKAGWIHVTRGPAHPDSAVLLMVDKQLLTMPAVQYDIRWSYLAETCIDLLHVHHVWFMVHGDQNYPADYVDKIVFTVRPLF